MSQPHEPRTFEGEERLPHLPLLDLTSTLNLYLASLKPFVGEAELVQSGQLVQDFKDGIGPELQEKLEQRAQEKRNWLEDWWLKYGYLTDRAPLSIGTNFGGICLSPNNGMLLRSVHGANPDKCRSIRAKTLATFLFRALKFWILLRREAIPPIRDSRGNRFSMHQFRFLFNSARVPRPGVDEIKAYFKTELEGECPNHILVIHGGRFFTVAPFNSDREPWTVEQLEDFIVKIEKKVEEERKETVSIGTLTTADRDTWAKIYGKLEQLSANNLQNLELINSSILVAILDDSCPETDDELLKIVLGGSGNFSDVWD